MYKMTYLIHNTSHIYIYVLEVIYFATGRWFSPGPPVSSTNKTDQHHITEILLKVVLNNIKQTNNQRPVASQ
jgi:hypothetical protein